MCMIASAESPFAPMERRADGARVEQSFSVEKTLNNMYNISMTVPYARIKNIEDRLARTEKELDRLVKSFGRSLNDLMGLYELVNKHLHMHDVELTDAFDRIKNMELKFFPNLARDVDRLHKIIGQGEDLAHNPLDHRRKPPKKR
jgi:hypothetical protein